MYVAHSVLKMDCEAKIANNYFMLIGVGPFASPGGLSRSIQLLHLDKASVEDFIGNLTNDHSCSFRNGHKDLLDVRMNRY